MARAFCLVVLLGRDLLLALVRQRRKLALIFERLDRLRLLSLHQLQRVQQPVFFGDREFGQLPMIVLASFRSALRATSMFGKLANATSTWTGCPSAFVLAVATVAVWAVTGPIFHYSDTWQLVINTGTTIITFLMVFLIQNAQNRDTLALHVKLSELIVALEKADNRFAAIEDASDDELVEVHEELKRVADAAGRAAGASTEKR
jgi:low affinity Fe/Cu permease